MEQPTLFRLALASRGVIWILQVIFGLFPDHEMSKSDVYLPEKRIPKHPHMVQLLFGGFGNWDSEHFILISEHGYIYEQSLAFFPLLPALINLISSCLAGVLQLSARSRALVIGWFFNNILFPITTVILFNLIIKITRNRKLAMLSCLLFVVNPANVFMSSVYSETLFAFFSFGGMLSLECHCSWLATSLFLLAGSTRSNGILLIMYIAWYHLEKMAMKGLGMKTAFSALIPIVLQSILVLMPYLLFQMYGYAIYCGIPDVQHDWIAKLLRSVSGAPQLRDLSNPSWCNSTIPFPYSHVQDRYWNAGFLKYYELKQIPNFLLAAPMIITSTATLWFYCKDRSRLFYLTPYVCHLGFMLAFGVTSIHIQVITRFIASSSPLIYCFGADCILKTVYKEQEKELYPSLWSVNKAVLTRHNMFTSSLFILIFFESYSLLGILLHTNFLPWT